MDLSFYPLTLEAIDQAAAESLCLFVAADERPLTGLAGLADWRLSGRLSRLLRSGLLTGDAGEAVLTPPGSRLAFRKLFLFGVGKIGQTEQQLVLRVAEALRKLAQAGVQEAALQLPARLPVEVGMRTLIDELQGPGRALLFGPDPQKLVMALSHAASRGSAQFERRVVKVTPPPPVKSNWPVVKPQQRPPQAAPGFRPADPAQPKVASAVAPAVPVAPALPKASPLPFAPQRDLPAQQLPPLTQPPPRSIPKAAPLPTGPTQASPTPVAPTAEPLPTGPTQGAPLPAAPASTTPPLADEIPAAAKPPAPTGSDSPPAEERRPAPPPSQRYVPSAPKQNVFDKGRHKKK